MKALLQDMVKKMLRLRFSQIIINERLKQGDMKIPLHLALGHEAIAIAVDATIMDEDNLFLTHRNIHYNLARLGSLRGELDEYLLRNTGMAHGHLGSMNLSNPERNIAYSSSILGNNQAVSSGFALGNQIRGNKGVVFVTTGDGGIEEGCFYESLLFQKSNHLAVVTIVENNRWSLATEISERRAEINLKRLTSALDIEYHKLRGNNIFEYAKKLRHVRLAALQWKSPVCVEVELTTLGYWYKNDGVSGKGRLVNYHAGSAPTIGLQSYPIISRTVEDPLFVCEKMMGKTALEQLAAVVKSRIEAEIA
jgi:TPP-dependent pyruvate/acetoin dehydrogenase alpha subunit